MGLWIFGVDARDDEIEQACKTADEIFRVRGISPSDAQDAALDAIELTEDAGEASTPRVVEVATWYAAENAAFQVLNELTTEWPHGGSLVFTEES